MIITVTGGTGFIGNYVVKALLDRGIEVIVTGTDIQKAREYAWFDKVNFIKLDINAQQSEEVLKKIAASDKLIHLAWSGLPNYKELFHFEENLLPQYFFLKELVTLGLKDITITGTCFEYGLKEGSLEPELPSDPQNSYALAKDSLRKFLQELQKKESFKLKWLRLFYMYGEGQNSNSLIPQLNRAITNGEEYFNMSPGDQLRDYLPVEQVAAYICTIALQQIITGIINCCSGQPISIKQFIENYLKSINQSVKLNPGYYPYSDLEPFAFWGDTKKLNQIIK